MFVPVTDRGNAAMPCRTDRAPVGLRRAQSLGALALVVALVGCAQGPNGGWRPLFPGSTPPPAGNLPAGASASPTAPPLTSNGPMRNRFGALFGDLQRRADVQARLAAEQERRIKDLSDLERDIEKERLALKEKRQELDKENAQRELLAQKSQEQRESQVNDMRLKANTLDTDNRDLQSLVAGSQQEIRRLQGEMQAMREQLDLAARQLTDSERSRLMSEQRVQALQASVEKRGAGAFATNNSLRRTLTAVTVEGLDIRQDRDLVRITLPSDQIFLPGTATLHQAVSTYLDQVAAVITKHYPNQIIGIEAHFDTSSLAQTPWSNAHQLTSAQAMAVFEQLSHRQGLQPRQMFVLGHGANHPLASNQTEPGRARNRRVEVVIYPERPE